MFKFTNLKFTKNIKKTIFEGLPSVWSYEIWTGILIFFISGLLNNLINTLIVTRDSALTTANIGYVLFSPQGLLIIILLLLMIFIYFFVELFGEIILTSDVFIGQNNSSVFKMIISALKRSFLSIRLFLNPLALIVLVYIYIITPLIGIGYTVSLSKDFYIPKFIMDVIEQTKQYSILYNIFIIIMLFLGVIHCFTLHGVLLNKQSLSVAMKESRRIFRVHWKELLLRMFVMIVSLTLIQNIIFYILFRLPANTLDAVSKSLPINYTVDTKDFFSANHIYSGLDIKILLVRVLSVFTLLESRFILVIIKLLCNAYFMLSLTRYFLDYNDNTDIEYSVEYNVNNKRIKYTPKIIICIIISMLFAFISIYLGLNIDLLYDDKYDSNIIAHRTAGKLANENSIEGLEVAISRGCYGAETDIQRTKDGYYIINHDDNFNRLAGVNKSPKDMTLGEIRELKLKDPARNDKEYTVSTIEEFLDVIKGKIKLFIELKGVTADKQMVDDIVKIVKEKDCINDVALISLNYDVINYAEEKYKEFETGILFYGGIGNVLDMKADWILMEEELAGSVLTSIDNNDKKYGIWTINNEKDMIKSFDYGTDGIITDDIDLYYKVKNEIRNRTDFQILKDWMGNTFHIYYD